MRGLDGLRALAVVAVVAYHFGLPGAGGGFLGVDAFFVISGFLVTRLLSNELRTSGRVDIVQFWVRRLRRLLPALFAMLSAAAIVYGYRIPEKLRSGRLDLAAGALFAGNWRMIASSTSYFDQLGRPPLTRHLWSLGIEGQFYAAWPLLVVGLAYVAANDRRRMAVLTALLGVLSAAWCAVAYRPNTDPSRVYFGTDTRLVGILFGAALALWLSPSNSDRARPNRRSVDVLGAAALAAFVAAVLFVDDRAGALYRGGFGLVAAVIVVVVWSTTVPGSVLERTLSVAPLRWIGVRSYSLYLWHWPVVALSQPGVDVPVDLNQWLLAAGRLAVSLALTEVSFRFVEEPFRRRLFSRWFASMAGQAGALRRSTRWYGGTLVATLFVFGAASGVSRASQNDGIADSLKNPTDEVVVATGTGPSAALPTVAAPAVVTPSSVVPTTFPPPPPDPKLPLPTLKPKSGEAGVAGVAVPIATTTMPRPPAVLAIGDSIMKGAAPSLSTRLGDGSVIDAAVSRPFTAGIKEFAAQTAKHPPFGAVVVHLGNNGVPSHKQFVALLDALGPTIPVVFITMRESREWAPKLNDLIRKEAASHPNVHVLEWDRAAGTNEYLFAKDKLHLTGTGGRYYSDLIVWSLAQAGYGGIATPVTTVVVTTLPTTAPPTSTVLPATTTSAPPTTTIAPTTTLLPPTTTTPASLVTTEQPAA